MSAKKQEPKILNTTDFQPDGFKWTRLKKIDWEDETGRKVSRLTFKEHTKFGRGTEHFILFIIESMGSRRAIHEGKGRRRWYAFLKPTFQYSLLIAFPSAVAIVALLDHPSKPLSTVILEQYRPPIGNTCIGKYLLFRLDRLTHLTKHP